MLYKNNELSSIVKSIQILTPPKITRKETSLLYTIFQGIGEALKIVLIDKVNALYDSNFIKTATDSDLDDLIFSKIKERRYNDESDESYRERYYKYLFDYNCTEDKLSQIVLDITGDRPKQMLELNSRLAYWGKANLPLEERIPKKAYYYNDPRKKILWGGNYDMEKAFIGYIFLNERPDDETIFRLKKVIKANKACGVKIYIVVPEQFSPIQTVKINNTYTSEIDEVNINWS